MNRPAAVSIGLALLLAGCSGSSSAPGAIPPVASGPAASGPAAAGGAATVGQLDAFQIPIVTDPAVESAERAPAGARSAQNSYGGVPGRAWIVPPVPVAAPSTVPSAGRKAAGLRQAQNSYGGVPAQATIIDAPGFPPGSQVNVAIVAVDAMAGGVPYPIIAFASPVVVNVLNYQRAALLIGSGTIPALQYDGVQYVIDPAHSSVVVNGQTFPMVFGTFANRSFVPSGGDLATLYFPAAVNAAVTSPSFVVDFNTAEWISLRDGIAEVGPQWGGADWSQAAVIDGTVVNASGHPVAGATVAAYGPGGVQVGATRSDASGAFEIHAVNGGSYSLTIYNTYAPPTSDQVQTATGNDLVDESISGPSFTVPAGYRINIGAIVD